MSIKCLLFLPLEKCPGRTLIRGGPAATEVPEIKFHAYQFLIQS